MAKNPKLTIEQLAKRWCLDSLAETKDVAQSILPPNYDGMFTYGIDTRLNTVFETEGSAAFLGITVQSLVSDYRGKGEEE